MNRWRMNKMGFLHFWLYDREEFPLHNGHILLRGNNGSGKSITTQSFIPFLLDGDRRPERLDPFGSRDRKMEFYLLGEDEREESTGYLYLEFKRELMEEYLTIGVGMRAKQGGGFEFWGFCLNDGRRIGPDGLCLYEKAGNVLMPLTKQKLFNQIKDMDSCAEKPEKYKELVNNRLFHFRDIRQYDQLVQLLINVRTPKLSKDALRPSRVRSILNESLQVLTDEDLSAMASTLERMDALEENLLEHKAMVKAAQIIQNEYLRYNQLVLGRKGKSWLEARGAALRTENRRKDEETHQGMLREQLSEQSARMERSARLLEQAKARRAALGEDDLSAKRASLTQLQGKCAAGEHRLEQEMEELHRLQREIDKRELRLRELVREMDNRRAAARLALQELNDENVLLALGAEHDDYQRAWAAGSRNVDKGAVFAALQQRKKQIGEVLHCLEQVKQAAEHYEEACRLMEQADTVRNRARGELRDAEQLEQSERDRVLEGFTAWRFANTQLLLPEADWQTVRRALQTYQGPADWGVIRDRADDCVRKYESALTGGLLRAGQRLEALSGEHAEKRQALEALKAQPEPVPPRRGAVQDARTQLLLRGIPSAAFYETVDFDPSLTEEERDLLEAQLSDAGLLDALLVPPEHLEDIRALLETYPDRFLLPSAPVEQPLTGLVPVGTFAAQAAECLRGISRSDPEAQTAILPDGRFRCGIVHGRSHAEGPAGYLGAEARKRNRERQLQGLEKELALLDVQIEEARAEESRCKLALECLRTERGQMPSAADLDHALGILQNAGRVAADAEAELGRRQAAEHRAYQAKARLEQECRSRSAGLPYAREAAAYEEALLAAESYQELLLSLDAAGIELRAAEDRLEEIQDSLEEQQNQTDYVKKRVEETRKLLEMDKAQAEEAQAFLNRPENREKAERLEALAKDIEQQDAENRGAAVQCAALYEQLKASEAELKRVSELLLEQMEYEQISRAYFEEELRLGFSGLDPESGLEGCAKEAVSQIRQSDRERMPEQLNDVLSKIFQQHNNSLFRYHPEIKTVFEPSERVELTRQRKCITLRISDQELALPDAIQALQDKILMTAGMLEDSDRSLFEEILTETLSNKLRARISESQRWTADMTNLMKTLRTSMGLTFELAWRPKRGESEEELDTAQLVKLLNKDASLLASEDSQRISAHFRAKVKHAREEASVQNQSPNYTDLIRGVLDYRNWYEFQLYYQREGELKKELTDRVFNRFSGGEKAMAMYVPLFAAVSAQYRKGSADCPLLLALDEAFAGVDDQNIGAMFELVRTLGFDYIMNSQALWGCYACVDDLDIAELHRPSNAQVVAILRYYWNGAERCLVEEDV